LALFLETSTDGQTPFAAVRDQAHALLASARLQQLFCRHLAGDGSLDYARKQARHYTLKAQDNLQLFPESMEKGYFWAITEELLRRTH